MSAVALLSVYAGCAVDREPPASTPSCTEATAGLKIDAIPKISILPEVGAYWYEGRIGDLRTTGPGFQYGIMLATSF